MMHYNACLAVFRIRIRIHIGSRNQSDQWILIRIRIRNPDADPGGQKRPTKEEKI